MEIKRIVNISPVSRPTWAKMCNTTRDPETGYITADKDDWWYVEVVQWANVVCTNGPDESDEYPAIFGCYMETEEGVGIAFVEVYEDGFLTYTTEEPAYMDCVGAKDGSDVKKVTRSDKYAPVTKESLIAALEKSKGNKKIAAKLLGIHRGTIFKVIKKYGLTDAYIKPYKTK